MPGGHKHLQEVFDGIEQANERNVTCAKCSDRLSPLRLYRYAKKLKIHTASRMVEPTNDSFAQRKGYRTSVRDIEYPSTSSDVLNR